MVATWIQEGQEYLIKLAFEKVQVANEVQTLDITADAGTYKLSFEGDETASLNYNDNAAAIDTALENLASIPTGAVAVTGSFPNFTVTFGGFLAGTPVPLISLSTNALTIASSPGDIDIARTTTGAGTIPQYYWIGLSQDLREDIGEDGTLADINEVSGTGYARVRVRTDTTDWSSALIGAYWQTVSKALPFAASGTWTNAQSMFLATSQDNSGVLLDVGDLAADFTLSSGQSRSFNMTQMFTTPAS